MWFGQFFHAFLEVFFFVMWLPITIKQGEQMYPKHKLEVANKSSGIVNWMGWLGQAFGPIQFNSFYWPSKKL